jgi:hypothetical protein
LLIYSPSPVFISGELPKRKITFIMNIAGFGGLGDRKTKKLPTCRPEDIEKKPKSEPKDVK